MLLTLGNADLVILDESVDARIDFATVRHDEDRPHLDNMSDNPLARRSTDVLDQCSWCGHKRWRAARREEDEGEPHFSGSPTWREMSTTGSWNTTTSRPR